MVIVNVSVALIQFDVPICVMIFLKYSFNMILKIKKFT